MDETLELAPPPKGTAIPPLQAEGRLMSLTRPLPALEVSPLEILRSAPLRGADSAPRTYWADSEEGIAGIGAAAVLTASGPARFSRLQEQAHRLFAQAYLDVEGAPKGVGPRLLGGFAFRAGQEEQGIWKGFPGAYVVLPRYQITRRGEGTWLTVNRLVGPEPPERAYEQLVDELKTLEGLLSRRVGLPSYSYSRSHSHSPHRPHRSRKMAVGEIEYLIDPGEWQRLVEVVTKRIRSGELTKVVLAQAAQVLTDPPVDPLDVLAGLERRYSNCYRFYVELEPGCAFYGATPELLAEVEGGWVRAVALAGSIARGASPSEDEKLAQALLQSEKDQHEHALVVEAVCDSLEPLTEELWVEGPRVVKFTNIQHLQTVIEGKLSKPGGVLPVVEALHPTPAVGGVPRDRALRLIEELEPFSRGGYASPIGWLAPEGDGRFAVALRSAVTRGRETRLYAGAGIVADSQPEREWNETLLKLQAVLEALRAAADASPRPKP